MLLNIFLLSLFIYIQEKPHNSNKAVGNNYNRRKVHISSFSFSQDFLHVEILKYLLKKNLESILWDDFLITFWLMLTYKNQAVSFIMTFSVVERDGKFYWKPHALLRKPDGKCIYNFFFFFSITMFHISFICMIKK